MQNVSQEYKQSMKQPIRNKFYMKISLGLINQDAQISANVEGKGQYTQYSDFENIFTNNEIGNVYATYEQDFFKVDGSMFFMPRDAKVLRKNGIITTELFSFETLVKFTFGCGSTDIKGLTIQFGENYPTQFSVIASSGEEFAFDNDKENFETDTVFKDTESLELKIISMRVPNGRVRIYNVKFGLGLNYDNEWIKNAELTSSLSAINEDLPETDFEFTLKNDGQVFNVDNPSSTINFLETGQKASIMLGYELDNEKIEWLKIHTLFLSEWNADDVTAKMKVVDRFKFMSDHYYRGQYYVKGISLYDLAELVFEDAGITSEEYYLDSYLKKVIVYNPLPNVTHKEALQIIANAGRCIMDYDRYGKIRIYSAFIPNFSTTSNGTEYYSDVQSIDNKSEKSRYATYERDYWSVDGKMLFLQKDFGMKVQNTGYVSKQISGENGLFEENPIIRRTLEAKYKCFGIKIDFVENLPKKFLIRTYSDDMLNEAIAIDKDIVNEFELYHEFKEFNKIEIEFTETEIPNNRIKIDYISFGAETNYRVEYDDLYSTPIGTQLEMIKNIKVNRHLYTVSSGADEELANDEITYEGENLIYNLNEACYGYTVSIIEGSANEKASIVDSGAYFVELHFSGIAENSSVKFSLKGRKYNLSASSYITTVDKRGVDKEWDNPIISDSEHCKKVAEWLATYYKSRVSYDLDYRGDPAIDVGDTIYQDNKYNDELKVIVEESHISFNGGVNGTLMTRRKEYVDRAKNELGYLR
jgi:hypothetical protein